MNLPILHNKTAQVHLIALPAICVKHWSDHRHLVETCLMPKIAGWSSLWIMAAMMHAYEEGVPAEPKDRAENSAKLISFGRWNPNDDVDVWLVFAHFLHFWRGVEMLLPSDRGNFFIAAVLWKRVFMLKKRESPLPPSIVLRITAGHGLWFYPGHWALGCEGCLRHDKLCVAWMEIAGQWWSVGPEQLIGSVWACCPQRRGFDPPLGKFSGRGDFSLGS